MSKFPLWLAMLAGGVALLVLTMKKNPLASTVTTSDGPGWLYKQSTGELFYAGARIGKGYSGAGRGKDNPLLEGVPNVGPIPAGTYQINAPIDSDHVGPFALALTPIDVDPVGRSEFFIHGDSLEHPGQASQGCIVLPRAVREQVWNSGDFSLTVVA